MRSLNPRRTPGQRPGFGGESPTLGGRPVWWLVGLGAVAAAVGLLMWRLDPDLRLRREVAARDPLPDAD